MRGHSKRKAFASVQGWLPLEAIEDDMVRLRDGEHRAVLRVSAVNFALKSELEQEAILSGYRRFLNGLSYPLQLLVRIAPADIEAYLAGLRSSTAAATSPTLRRLLRDHERFVRTTASERVLLDRRYYIVIPAGLEGTRSRASIRWPWQHGGRQAGMHRSDIDAQRRRLSFRCDEVTQGLALFGVQASRLDEHQLLRLWREMLGEEHFPRRAPLAQRSVVTAQHRERVLNHA